MVCRVRPAPPRPALTVASLKTLSLCSSISWRLLSSSVSVREGAHRTLHRYMLNSGTWSLGIAHTRRRHRIPSGAPHSRRSTWREHRTSHTGFYSDCYADAVNLPRPHLLHLREQRRCKLLLHMRGDRVFLLLFLVRLFLMFLLVLA